MLRRLLRPPEQSFFLFGARGTGKSTWAHAESAGHPYFDLLDQEAYFAYEREPGRFGRQLAALRPGETVVDEIQRIPALLNEVHRAIEARGQKFVLLVSSAPRKSVEGYFGSWRTRYCRGACRRLRRRRGFGNGRIRRSNGSTRAS